MSNERRRGGRNERRNQALQKIEQPPSFQPKHRFEPLRAVSDDELESIHMHHSKFFRNWNSFS